MNINSKLGLMALTVEDEQKELSVVTFPPAKHSIEARAKAAELRGHRIMFEFMQSDFKGGYIVYWRVTDPASRSYGSSLSMQGLKTWKVNMRAGR